MADWMGQMADAVEEAEAANAVRQEEVPTEPALSPRSHVIEVPLNNGRWTTEEYAELLFYIAHELNERDKVRLQELLDKQQADARAQTQQLQSMKHINGVSKNGKLRSKLESYTIQHSRVVPLLKELRRCVCFPMSMRPFVRMIQA